jgi:hypothetical protein
VIFINMIRLSNILVEQKLKSQQQVKQEAAKKLALQIYDSKGYVWDDEDAAESAIKQILSIEQYKLVNTELQKLTNKRGLGEYIHSFMNFRDLYKVAEHLVKVLPQNSWGWTVKKVFTWEDLIEEVSYRRPGAAGMIPSSSRRPSEAQTLQMLFNQWAANKKSIKKDLLYKMLMEPALYASNATNLLPAFKSHEMHAGLENTASLLYFAGPVGIGLATLAMSADAKLYWDEGNKLGAGISAFFAALPFINQVVRRIPAVQKFKRAALAKLGAKISKFKSFSKTGSFKSITEKELASLPDDEANLIRQFQQHEKFLYDSVKTPSETWKAILKDPKLQAYKKSLTPEEWQSVQSGIFNGKYTYQDIKQMAEKKFAAQGIGITAGIKFSPSEMAQLDQVTAETEQLITLYNKNQSIDKTFKIKDTNVRTNWAGSYEVPSRTNPGQMHRKNITPAAWSPRMSTRDVNVHIIPISKAYAEGMKNARGWAAHNGDIYMVLDYFVKNGKFSKQDFKSVLTHELAHVKDPALKQSAKLNKTYNPNAGKPWSLSPDIENSKQNWFKNYYFHDFEQSALRPQALEQINHSTQRFAKSVGKKKTIKILDDAINFFKTSDEKYWTPEVTKLLYNYNSKTGAMNQSAHTILNTLSANSPNQYNVLKRQMVKQLQSNKSEILKMKNIADGVIKLKDLL